MTDTRTNTEIQKWGADPSDAPGPRQLSAINKALRSLAFAGRGRKVLTGTIGAPSWCESHEMGALFTGERNPMTVAAECAIGNGCGWLVSKKNASKLRKAIEAATKAADDTIPIVDEREPAEVVEQRNTERTAKMQEQNTEREAAEAVRVASCAPILAKKPPNATAVIVAELDVSDCDSMTDYFAHHSTRTVVIGFRSGSRENFRALRLAAAAFEPTSHLGPDAASTVEHRDNHSMGGGNFVKDGYQHSGGWRVFSRNLTDDGQIPRLGMSELEDGIPDVAAQVPPTSDRFEIIDTENKRGPFVLVVALGARVDRVTFEGQRDRAKAAGGWYSRKWGKTPGGFGFNSHEDAEAFTVAEFGADAPTPPDAGGQREGEALRLEALADNMQSTIDGKRSDLTQNWTARRARIKEGQRLDADRLEQMQRALRAIAKATRANTLPPILATLNTKTAIAEALGGYRAQTPIGEALSALIEDSKNDADREAEADRESAAKLRELEDTARQCNVPGFFPTPAPVVDRMLEAAQIDGERRYCFLEPSAGIGSIAEQLRPHVARNGGGLVCVEVSATLCAILAAKGFDSDPGCTVIQNDFLTMGQHSEQGTTIKFDRILMNPPFEKRADVEHVGRALAHLEPGGLLVALVTPRGAETLEAECAEAGYVVEVEQLPAGSFTGTEAFRQTGVSVAMVTITA